MSSYPQIYLFAVTVLGLGLVVYRPFWAFLFSLILLVGGNVHEFNAVRTVFLGPYFNLTDLCLFIAFLSCIQDFSVSGKRPKIPLAVVLLLVPLIWGVIQSLSSLGMTYETLRAFRWGLQFPVAILLGANMIDSPERARVFLKLLFFGVVLASLQHIVTVAVISDSIGMDISRKHFSRIISYPGGYLQGAFLVAFVVWHVKGRLWSLRTVIPGAVLIATSMFYAQTRSVWLATAVSLPLVIIFFRKGADPGSTRRTCITVTFLALVLLGLSRMITPDMDMVEVASVRIKKLLNPGKGSANVSARVRSLRAEVSEWRKGNILTGRGLYYFQALDKGLDAGQLIAAGGKGNPRIAYGHLGYVTYLSQLGILGLLIYAVYLPMVMFRLSMSLWSADRDTLRYMGLLGISSIISLGVMFTMSSCFLFLGYFGTGILYGGLWRLSSRRSGEGSDDYDTRTRISIVTPSLDQAEYIEDAITSVTGQRYAGTEYVIMDGGSSDGSVDIIKRYENCISSWESAADAGQSDAINSGFEKTSGEWLCWLNADDVLFPGTLALVGDISRGDPCADIITGNVLYVDENDAVIRCIRTPRMRRVFCRNGMTFFAAPAIFFKRDLFKKAGKLDRGLHVSMDLDLWYRFCGLNPRIVHTEKYLGAFRLHERSKTVSFKTGKRRYEEHPETVEVRNRYLPGLPSWRVSACLAAYRVWQTLNMNYFRAFVDDIRWKGKDWKEAVKGF